jgi:oxalate decarboxylase/phosphoglucose isomerase-like protein (cupin superfamily)
MQKRVVYHVSEIKPFSPPAAHGEYASKLLIDRIGMDSEFIILNEFTLKVGCQTYQGDHGPGYDEVYYVLEGKGVLYLEDLETGDYEPFDMRSGSYAFIKGGRGHYIKNVGDTDLLMLTFMPKNPPHGVNTVYDARIAEWGTSFELIDKDEGTK